MIFTIKIENNIYESTLIPMIINKRIGVLQKQFRKNKEKKLLKISKIHITFISKNINDIVIGNFVNKTIHKILTFFKKIKDNINKFSSNIFCKNKIKPL